MIDPTIPSATLLAALHDAAAVVLDHADRCPDTIGQLPEPMRIWIAAAEPAIRSMASATVQRVLWPDAPVIGDDGAEPRRAKGGR